MWKHSFKHVLKAFEVSLEPFFLNEEVVPHNLHERVLCVWIHCLSEICLQFKIINCLLNYSSL